ncbi:autoinducer-2 kinase [Oceanivirga salmonicida]|uniref:autoinducer-2 kinase n=1 Tax=Oceanivirga salmonicida TaxID=1769291 RepID=UPI0012E2F6BE|nr:autoinducer-2 kinase [Oceanivirga salmonicida]
MKKYLMAIDAGTGSVRSIIFDENFNQIAISQREWVHPKNDKYDGAIDFDTKQGKKLMFDTIKEVIKISKINPKDIKAISSTSMREGFVLYNNKKEEIWAVSNVDSRAINEVYELKKNYPYLEDEIYNKSGQTFALSAIPRLLWLKKNIPDLYKETKYINMLNDWILFCLSGVIMAEPSNSSTTGIVNSNTRNWDNEVIKKCNIKSDIFPKIYESGSKIGYVSKEISKLTGLSTECVVAAGGGDVQLGCLGVGAVNSNNVTLLGGSFWQLEYNTNESKIDKKGLIRVNCHVIKNMWQQELIAFFPGLVLRYFRDTFCKYEKIMAKEKGINVYDFLNDMAKDVPIGCYGMQCSFSSVMNFKNWQYPAPVFTGFDIDKDKFGIATFYRSILESSALVTLGHKLIIEETFGNFPAELIFASGASFSDLWCQIVADALNVTVKVPVIKEATALGAAFCAGLSINLHSSLNDFVSNYVKFEKTFLPNEENHKKYLEIYSKYQEILNSQLNLSKQKVLEFMWKAPGV